MDRKEGGRQSIRLTRRNWIHLAVLTIIFCLAAVIVYKTTIAIRVTLPRITTLISAAEDSEYEIKDKDHLEQVFTYPKEALLSAGIKINVNEDDIKELAANDKKDLGKLNLTITDLSSGQIIMQDTYEVYMLEDEQNLIASFPEARRGWQGKELKVTLDVEKLSNEVELSVKTAGKVVEGSKLQINGQAVKDTLNIRTSDHQFLYWKKWAAFGAALVYFLIAGTYLLLAVAKSKPQKVFLFTGTMLGVIYLLILPPFSVPDEYVHYKEAYYYSNQLMGIDNGGEGTVLMDAEDLTAMDYFQPKPSLSEYDVLKEEIKKSGRIEGEKAVERFDTMAPAVTYLPGIAGITAGRLLGLNGVLVIYLGRLFSMLFYLFVMYWTIKLMPFGKAAAFILAILPMTIQECASYSYDAVIIEVAFFYLALLFRLLYKKGPLKKWEIALYTLCMVMMAICKGGAYLPLCLLTLLIPVDRFRDKKQKKIFVLLMAFAAIAAFLVKTLGYALYVLTPTAEQAAGSYLGTQSYGLTDLLHNPWVFFNLAIRTVILSGDGLFEQMMGMQLGWLNVDVSRFVIYGMFTLMVIAILKTENKKEQMDIEVTKIQKLFFAAASLMSVGMVFMSMFLSWTPKLSTTIAGLQGRYFLPLLPLVLLMFRNHNITVKKDRSSRLMFFAASLQCVAIYCILLSLERVL